VKVDEGKAAQLYTQAAEQGHAGAQQLLGLFYATGFGVEGDEAKAAQAAQLLGHAAEQGHADAQYNRAGCYSTYLLGEAEGVEDGHGQGCAASQAGCRAGPCYRLSASHDDFSAFAKSTAAANRMAWARR
jgi:TPR repeat protein